MRYEVLVKPGSSREEVVETEDGLVVWTRKRAHDGEANRAVAELLAKHFGVAKTSIKIVRGENARRKVVEV